MRGKLQTRRQFRATHLLGADNIDTSGYHGHIGDVIRIEPFAPFDVGAVRVTIRGPEGQLLERGLATRERQSRAWLYAATAENSEFEDWAISSPLIQ